MNYFFSAKRCTEMKFDRSKDQLRTERQFEGMQMIRAELLDYEKYLNKEREINERTGQV